MQADALSRDQVTFTHAEDGTILEMEQDEDQIMGDISSGGQGAQDAEAEIYLGALHDTAQSPYVPSPPHIQLILTNVLNHI